MILLPPAMKEFLQWNPIVPGTLLALMIYRASQRELQWVQVACIAIVAFWFCLAVIRLFSPRLRSMSAPHDASDLARIGEPASERNADEHPKHDTPMAKSLREYRMKFERVAEGGKAVPDRMKIGIRSKLGGEPDWEQGEDTPKCPDCKKAMTFIAQIDSMEHHEHYNPHGVDCRSSEQQYMFGDVGMIYVFMCFDCMETKSVLQSG